VLARHAEQVGQRIQELQTLRQEIDAYRSRIVRRIASQRATEDT
jgi:hypothetical protein